MQFKILGDGDVIADAIRFMGCGGKILESATSATLCSGGGHQTGADAQMLRLHESVDFDQRSASASTGRCYIRSAVNPRPQ